jgi:hypothetical protein
MCRFIPLRSSCAPTQYAGLSRHRRHSATPPLRHSATPPRRVAAKVVATSLRGRANLALAKAKAVKVLIGACQGDAHANGGVGPAKTFSRLTTGVVVHDHVRLASGWCHDTHRERRTTAQQGRICLAAARGLQMVCTSRGQNKVAAGRNDAYNAQTEIARARARDSKESGRYR